MKFLVPCHLKFLDQVSAMAPLINCLFVSSTWTEYEADCLEYASYFITKAVPYKYLENDMDGRMICWSGVFSWSLVILCHCVLFSAIVQSKMVREMTETGESVFRCLDCDHRSKRNADLAKHIEAKERFHLICLHCFMSQSRMVRKARNMPFYSLGRSRFYEVYKDM